MGASGQGTAGGRRLGVGGGRGMKCPKSHDVSEHVEKEQMSLIDMLEHLGKQQKDP